MGRNRWLGPCPSLIDQFHRWNRFQSEVRTKPSSSPFDPRELSRRRRRRRPAPAESAEVGSLMGGSSESDYYSEEEEEEELGWEEDEGFGSEEEDEEEARERALKKLEGIGKRGVCYLSRVPPNMNPSHVRQMLSKYGEVQRIYLVPEGQGHRKHTNVRAKAYTEGWIEFSKKSVAKRVANLLNGEQIGGKKRSPFFYDIWNIKYLKKFKWDDLVGEIAEKTHIREQKLNLEIAAAKKQRDHYLSNVEKSRALKHIQERRKKKQKTEGAEFNEVQEEKIVRPIPHKKPVEETDAKNKPKLSKDILAGVFGGPS